MTLAIIVVLLSSIFVLGFFTFNFRWDAKLGQDRLMFQVDSLRSDVMRLQMREATITQSITTRTIAEIARLEMEIARLEMEIKKIRGSAVEQTVEDKPVVVASEEEI